MSTRTMQRRMSARTMQREIEASIGGRVLEMGTKLSLKKSKLIKKKVYLPKSKIYMNYLEREPIHDTSYDNYFDTTNRPTILFCHGLGQGSVELALFIASLKIPPHIRILCPDQIGHGEDLERALNDPQHFQQPTNESMMESTSEFLDVAKVGNNCNAFGHSMGGGIVYFLRQKRKDIIKRTVLVSPAIVSCLDDDLIRGIMQGTNKLIAFESREDVKLAIRDMSTGRNRCKERKKKDPVPNFLLESVYRKAISEAPEGHRKELMHSLLTSFGVSQSGSMNHIDNFFGTESDIDQESTRLVIWPEKDVICSYEKGEYFFKDSIIIKDDTDVRDKKSFHKDIATEFVTIPDCGHAIHSDGRFLFNIIRPRVREYLLEFSSSNNDF